MQKDSFNALCNAALLGVILIAFIAAGLFLISVNHQGLMASPQLSLSRRLGIPWMPSYGLKTATWHFLQGNFSAAIKSNALIIIVIPITAKAGYEAARAFYKNIKFLVRAQPEKI